MDDIVRLEARIGSLKELRDLFAAIEAMAATRMQDAQRALAGARRYAGVVESAIADAVTLGIDDPPRVQWEIGEASSAIVVICSEQGFTGAFNRLIIERARAEARADDAVIIVGRRGAAIAPDNGLKASVTIPMATHINGVLGTARTVARNLNPFDEIHVVFGGYRGGSQFDVLVRQVLPPDERLLTARRNQNQPMHQLRPSRLLRQLIGELLLAELMLVLVESFASENAARLQIMQGADHNVGEKLERLTQECRRLRQDQITAELLEVVAGAEAVAGNETRWTK
jgi:F-type H+-transporting ATPase subunit gamma